MRVVQDVREHIIVRLLVAVLLDVDLDVGRVAVVHRRRAPEAPEAPHGHQALQA